MDTFFVGIGLGVIILGLWWVARRAVPPTSKAMVAVLTGSIRAHHTQYHSFHTWDTESVTGVPMNCDHALVYLLGKGELKAVPNMFGGWYEANEKGLERLRQLAPQHPYLQYAGRQSGSAVLANTFPTEGRAT